MTLPLLWLSALVACGDKDPGTQDQGDSGAAGDGGVEDGGADGGAGDGGVGDGGAEDGGADGGGEEATLPDLPTGWCDEGEHAWLPLQEMGRLVEVQEAADISLDAATIDSVLDAVGFDALTPVAYGVKGFRIRYTSQDRGEPVQVTGLLVLPDVPEPMDVPTLLWTHPTTGFSDGCAPSSQGVIGAAYGILLAAQGFAVTAPDLLGMDGSGEPSGRLHPWVVPEPTAIVALDAVRALQAFSAEQAGSWGIDARPDLARTVVWGASEGGFGALWADRYQAEYLPEAQLVGVIAAIPPTDPAALGTIGLQVESPTTASIAAALATMADWHGTTAPLSEVLLPPFDVDLPETLASTCEGWDDVFGRSTAPELIYQPDFLASAVAGAWDAVEPWGCYLQSGVLRDAPFPRGSTAPVLVVTGEADTLAWPEPVLADIPVLCDQGYAIEHRHCAGAGHTEAGVESLPYQLQWARTVAGGGAVGADCAVSAPVDCTAL